MRICHIIHTFPPFSRAGSENYLEALAREQARRHDVTVFHRVADPGRPEYEVTEADVGGLAVTRVNRAFADFSGFPDTYRSAGVDAAFGAHLDAAQADVAHFHHLTCLSTSCVGEARERGLAVVFTLHDFWLACPRGQLLRRDLALCRRHDVVDCVRCVAAQLPIEGGHPRVTRLWERAKRLRRLPIPAEAQRRLASQPFSADKRAIEEVEARNRAVLAMAEQVDLFVSPSAFLRDVFVAFGFSADKILVSDNGFDVERWPPIEVRPRRPAGSPLRAAYLGTWIPSKGVDVLVRAFRGIDPAVATLDLHGYAVPYDDDDGYEARLRELAGGAPHIRFRGRYEPAEAPKLLAEADVLVVPSIWYENSPLTVHEAWLAGLPVIAAGHGGLREHVRDGVDGLHFKPGSVRDLRHVLWRLAADRVLLDRLRQGVPAVKSIESNARELEELYGRILSAARRPRARGSA